MLSTSTSGCSLDRPGTSDEARTLRAELVGRAREIVPVLARNAARTEEQRRVVEENITLIDEAGLYSIMRPSGWADSRPTSGRSSRSRASSPAAVDRPPGPRR